MSAWTAWKPVSPASANGSRKENSRSRLYGSAIASTVARKISVPPISARLRIGVPAATSSAPMAKQITIVVPMSGCFMSRAQAAATTSSSGFAIVPIVRTECGRAASSCAA